MHTPDSWPSDPLVKDWMTQFPVALALLDTQGDPAFLNALFEKSFDRACFASHELQELLLHAGDVWARLKLRRRDGSEHWVQARCARLHDHVLLLLEARLDVTPEVQLEGLRARIAELERQGGTDLTTGSWNLLHLERVLRTELARSERLNQPLTLVQVELDHFERVAPAESDGVLRDLVLSMNSRVRAGDLVFRGEAGRFLMLLTATGYRHARTLAEELRAAVEAHEFEGVNPLTLSSGIAEHLPGEAREAWFLRLDMLLRESQQSGGNRITVDERGGSDEWAAGPSGALVRIEWQEAYECGQPLIDREHRELFACANAVLSLSCEGSDSPAALCQALEELLAHIAQHFSDEEALLERAGYAGLEAHKHAHQALLRRARELRRRAETGLVTTGQLMDFIAIDVVANHLLKSDRQFFPLLRARGVPACSAAPPPEPAR